MNKKDQNNSITYLNLCNNKTSIEQVIKVFFESQNYNVLSYLKEINNYVTITADYPVNRVKLLKILDPYRKYCNTILLIIVFDKKPVELNFPWNLTEFGISDIVCVDDANQIIEYVQTHFNHYVAINKLIKTEDLKKTNTFRQIVNSTLN